MMRSLHLKRWLAAVLVPALAAMAPIGAWAATQPAKQAAKPAARQTPQEEFVDGIAAIVNKHVITLGQVEAEVKVAQAQLRQRKIEAPDIQTLRKQVLQRMITDELINQEADRRSIKVADAQLQHAVESIAQRNRISVERLRQEIEKSGISWKDYLKNLRQDVRIDLLRQRAVDSTITVTDNEIDAYLKNQNHRAGPASPGGPQPGAQQAAPRAQALELAQILVTVPEGAPAATVAELRRKAEGILARLRGGADFASTAASSSDGPQALRGGELGVRPVEGWPDLFIQATANLQAGEISDIIQSGNGFHILKVVGRTPEPGAAAQGAPMPAPPQAEEPLAQGPMLVTQTRVRHILIKVNKAMSDERAHARLDDLRGRLQMGEDFGDLAKRYSEDASAPQGGELGWMSPGETVPPFERAMDALQPGQISEPVKSPFGWHLIQVEERRTKDMEEEYKRMQARQILFQRRAEPAFEDWLSQLHGQAYIDNRLDPQANRRPAR